MENHHQAVEATLGKHETMLESHARSLDKIDRDFGILRSENSDNFHKVFQKIESMSIQSRPNVGGIIGGIIAASTLGLGLVTVFISLTVNPLKDSLVSLDREVVEKNRDVSILTKEHDRQIGTNTARIDYIEKWLNNVDEGGSRKWNDDRSKSTSD